MTWILKIFKWFSIGLVSLIFLTLAGGRIYQVVSESEDLARYPAPGELIGVDDRIMHVNCIGEGSPTVIFELGVGSASAAWSDVHKQVSLFTRACAYDRAGLGYSEPTDQPLRSSNVAQRLQKLLRAAKIEDELVLVGWSAGGVYIREFYGRYPERVEAMLFVDSSHEQQATRMPQTSGNGSDPMLGIARRLAPFGIVRMSGILDRRVERGTGSDELKSHLKAIYHQSHILDTVWRESEAFNLDISATQPPSPVGDLPLIVLTRGNSDTSQQERDARNQLQQELTLLSTNGKQIIASESGHHVYSDQPELVIESVEDLVLQVRERQFLE
jgi:pimeloyl-ACP methyl ester carboxylesterase